MEVLNKESFGKCQICNVNPIIGLGYGNKWVCGKCLLKLEEKIKEQQKIFYNKIEKEIRENDSR